MLIRSRPEDPPNGILEVVFRDEAGEQVARNVSPFNVEPGKFTYRLVRGELEYPKLGTVEAHCRLLPDGQTTVVPLTLLAPLALAPKRPAVAGRPRRSAREGRSARTAESHDRGTAGTVGSLNRRKPEPSKGGHGARSPAGIVSIYLRRALAGYEIYSFSGYNWSRRRRWPPMASLRCWQRPHLVVVSHRRECRLGP